MKNIDIQEIWRLIVEAECLNAPLDCEKALNSIIQKIQAYDYDYDDEIYYALGYIWYVMPVETEERSHNAKKYLCAALKINPESHYANLYFGHILYDEKKYDEALAYFEKLPKKVFSKYAQAWRDVKTTELILCCHLYLHHTDMAWKSMMDFISICADTNKDEWPNTTELHEAFSNLWPSSR